MSAKILIFLPIFIPSIFLLKTTDRVEARANPDEIAICYFLGEIN